MIQDTDQVCAERSHAAILVHFLNQLPVSVFERVADLYPVDADFAACHSVLRIA